MGKLSSFSKIIIFTTLLFIVNGYTYAQSPIYYPQPIQVYNKHHLYPLSLLTLALSKVETSYTLMPADIFMNQGRALKQLTAGDNIDILWTMTSVSREQALHAIRIPIYKGLIGWRVFLSSTSTNYDSTKAIPLEQIKALKIIQGHDWPDTDILKYNHFNVQTGSDYAGLFKMLQYQRADLFPRSIIEVWDELKLNESSNLKLEQHTLISYPTASYFFVSKKNKKLAQAVQRGLEIALDDGSFDALFKLHFSKMIKQAKLSSRRHYRLENPLLTAETPLNNERLWFKPK